MTINEIAQLAGVSRGTVDRVLHNRGRVHPDVEERIRAIIADAGYTPNVAAAALKRSTQVLPLGVMLPPRYPGCNRFYDDVVQGVRKAEENLRAYGVRIDLRFAPSFDIYEVVQSVRELVESGIRGLALTGVDEPPLKSYTDSLDIPVVTLNTDFSDSGRLCFVGQDHLAAGAVAGRMLAKILTGPGKLLPLISFYTMAAHAQRIRGMQASLADCPYSMELLPPQLTWDSDDKAYDLVTGAIAHIPDLTCIYVAGGGQEGASQALADSGRWDQITMICHDLLPKTVEHIRRGIVPFTIGQQPFLQGYLPISILYDYLVLKRRPTSEFYYTSIDIRLRENIDYNGPTGPLGLFL